MRDLTITAALIAAIGTAVSLLVREAHDWLPWLAVKLIACSCRLLPAPVRGRYREEWTAELELLPSKGFTSIAFAVSIAARAMKNRRALRPLATASTWQQLRDKAVTLLLLISLAPVMVAIAILVKRRHPLPGRSWVHVFELERRIGASGRTIYLLAFSTAYEQQAITYLDASGRYVWVDVSPGRAFSEILNATSLVALPRLINVLRGDLTLFGPPAEDPIHHTWNDEHPFRAYMAQGGKPGLVSWTGIASALNINPDEALRRDLRLLLARKRRDRLRLLVAVFAAQGARRRERV